MLAYAAAWSFGDLAPESAQGIPVSPELPGTGVTKTLQLLALDPAGTRGQKERYDHFLWAFALTDLTFTSTEVDKVNVRFAPYGLAIGRRDNEVPWQGRSFVLRNE